MTGSPSEYVGCSPPDNVGYSLLDNVNYSLSSGVGLLTFKICSLLSLTRVSSRGYRKMCVDGPLSTTAPFDPAGRGLGSRLRPLAAPNRPRSMPIAADIKLGPGPLPVV